jgi:hypothetical protein
MATAARVEELDVGTAATKFVTRSSGNQKDLECFTCHDSSLYHDSYAYWNQDKDDLLCVTCFAELPDQTGYISVITYH